MDRAALLAAVGAAGLPPGAEAALRAVVRSGGPSPLRRALRREPGLFLAGLRGLLRSAAAAIGAPEDEALFATGFEAANLAPERLEAALAELCAVRYLSERGFTGLRLLPRQRGKTADMAGRLGGEEHVLEVCRVKEGAFEGPRAAAFAALKYDRKSPQVSATLKRGGPASGALVLVSGFPGFAGQRDDGALSAVARAALEGKRPPLRLCLLDGARAGAWPPWPAGPRNR